MWLGLLCGPYFVASFIFFGKSLYVYVVYIIKCLLVDATIVAVSIVIVMYYVRISLLQKDFHISPKRFLPKLEKKN